MKRGIINAIALGVFTIIFLITFAVSSAYPFEFSLATEYETKLIDVNKPSSDDLSTCMHAAVANAVSFSLGKDINSAFSLYSAFVEKLGKKATTSYVVWDALMDYDSIPRGWARYNSFHLVVDNLGRDWQDLITSTVHAGWVVLVILDISGQDVHHVVTVYGFKYDNDITSFLYVDSDDGKAASYWSTVLTDKTNRTNFIFYDGQVGSIVGYTAIKVVGKK